MNHPKPKILIIDDFELSRNALKEKLFRGGGDFEIIEADNPDDGLMKFKETSPDIVFLDLEMKQGDLSTTSSGLDVCAKLKSQPSPPFVIIRSTHSGETIEREAEIRGADGYLVKGNFSLETLYRLLSKAGVIIPDNDNQSDSEKKNNTKLEKIETDVLEQKELQSETPQNGKMSFGEWILERTGGIFDEVAGSALVAFLFYLFGKAAGYFEGLPSNWLKQPKTVFYIIVGILVTVILLIFWRIIQKRFGEK